MHPFGLELTRVSAAAAGALVAAVWEGLVLAGLVAICLRMLPRMTAAARSVVWLAVLGVVVALPFVHFAASGAAAGIGGSGGLRVDERVSLALVAVWAALSVWRAAELVRSAVFLRGIARRAVEVEVSPEIQALLRYESVEHVQGNGNYGDSGFARMTSGTGGRGVELCASEEVDRPSVVGFVRPRILIPAELLGRLGEDELAQIVMHEMEHLRRRDDWTNLAQKLALVVFPLNPVLVWVERRLCLERELACDDQVLRATNARKAYAACLANLAEHSLVRRGVSLALGAWERRPELVRRVHRILARPAGEMGRRQVAAVVSAMVFGLVAGADGLAHAPQLVSFGPKLVETAAVGGAGMLHPARRDGAGLNGAPRVSGKAQDVVFRVSAAGAKAVAPVPLRAKYRDSGYARMTALRRSSQGLAMVQEVRTAELAPDGMVVMVTWRTVAASNVSGDGSGDRTRGVAAAPQTGLRQDVRYAAVPTRDGWMIIQL